MSVDIKTPPEKGMICDVCLCAAGAICVLVASINAVINSPYTACAADLYLATVYVGKLKSTLQNIRVWIAMEKHCVHEGF